MQEAIGCRGAYGEQLVAALLREMEVTMLFQSFNEGGQEGINR